MNKSIVESHMQPAVLAKNHLRHLQAACDISAANADQLITFRSSRCWTGASRLLSGCHLPILFGVIDGGPEARYRAWLQEVVIKPSPSDPRSNELLQLRPDTTRDENWWTGDVKTLSLYAICGCHELTRPIPYAELIKQTGGKPLSDDYKYSYSLVKIADAGAADTRHIAVDLATPPARIDSVVSRIVRDTALTRQLKSQYDDRCQLCGIRLEFSTGQSYSEAHHLKPLGRPHNGRDVRANIIVVCPNCHAMCDHGGVTLAKATLTTVKGHEIADEFIEYHNRAIANG
jgi:hypothetical protein